jgi:translation elongation factor EF-1beta
MNLCPQHKDVTQTELQEKIKKELAEKQKKEDEEPITLEEFIFNNKFEN